MKDLTKKLSNNLVQVVKLLADGQFHTGAALGGELKITRSAISKLVQKLIQHNVPIVVIKNKGYQLKSPFVPVDLTWLKQNIDQDQFHIEVFENIHSTNDYLKNLPGDTIPRICLAEMQTAGRGRFNRPWHSPFG